MLPSLSSSRLATSERLPEGSSSFSPRQQTAPESHPHTSRSGAVDLFATCVACYVVGYFAGHVWHAITAHGWPFGVAL